MVATIGESPVSERIGVPSSAPLMKSPSASGPVARALRRTLLPSTLPLPTSAARTT